MWWWAQGQRQRILTFRHGHIRDESTPFGQKAAQNWSVCVQDPCCNPRAADPDVVGDLEFVRAKDDVAGLAVRDHEGR